MVKANASRTAKDAQRRLARPTAEKPASMALVMMRLTGAQRILGSRSSQVSRRSIYSNRRSGMGRTSASTGPSGVLTRTTSRSNAASFLNIAPAIAPKSGE